MEVTLKRITKTAAFADGILVLTQQKAYSLGRISKNDVVLFAPRVLKDHCIFHHNSNGLFVQVLKRSGVVVNGKKYSTGSMVPLHNDDIAEIELFKYQVVIKPDYESIKVEDLSDTNVNNVSELEYATGGIEDTDYEENWKSIQRSDSFNLQTSKKINEELIVEEETQETSLDEFNSSMQITVGQEDIKPLFPLNSTGEALTDPKTIVKISREPETLEISEFSNFAREETRLRRSRRIKPTLSDNQNKISVKENEISNDQVSENQREICKERSRLFKENNIDSNKERKISDGFPHKQIKIVLECLNIGNSENAVNFQTRSAKKLCNESVETFKTQTVRKLRNDYVMKLRNDSVRKLRNDSVRKLRNDYVRKLRNNSLRKLPTESSSPKRKLRNSKLETESVKKLETNFALEIDSVKNRPTESSLSETKLEINKTEHLPERKKSESSKPKIPEEINICQQEQKRFPEKRLSVTLIDILKNPISDFPSMMKLASESENLNRKRKPTRKRINSQKEEVISCTFCDKKLVVRNKSELEEHYRIHTGERPFVCELCEKTFRKKHTLYSHMRNFHVARFTCNECNVMFPNKTKLRMHMRIHFPGKGYILPDGRRMCADCGFVTLNPANFVYHCRVDTEGTGEKPFQCLLCHKTYASRRTLRIHMLLHTGDYPYRCGDCGKGFLKLDKLKIHCISHDKK